MGYDATVSPAEGEVCLRGPAVFLGYHKRPDLTQKDKCASTTPLDTPKAMENASKLFNKGADNGWFHTGDVGQLQSDGSLKIIDRKKNFFKLAHGEYVAAEKLENEYKKATLVDQIWVYGDSTESYLVAVVVPDHAGLAAIASRAGVYGEHEELCQSTVVKAEVQKLLETTGRASGMKGFEIVKQVHLFDQVFSTENDLMTPSFKLKRPQLKAYFAREVPVWAPVARMRWRASEAILAL